MSEAWSEKDQNQHGGTERFALILAVLTLILLILMIMMIFRVRQISRPGHRTDSEAESGMNTESGASAGAEAESGGNAGTGTESGTESGMETDTQGTPVGVTYPYAVVLKRDTYLPSLNGSTYHLPAGALSSRNAVIVNLDDLSVSAESGADERIYPASMTKIMTLMVACDYISDLNASVTVSEDAIRYAQSNGASVAGFLTAGETCTVKDLLYGVAVKSGAEATYMLVHYVADSEEAFVALMNQKCAELGLTRTHFSNAAGLHDTENYTTVREMAAILACALDNELCRTLLSTDTYVTQVGYRKSDGTSDSYRLTMYSTLFYGRIANNGYKKQIPGGMTIMGGKTGYIDYKPSATSATVKNYTLATWAEGNGKRYLVVTAGAVTSTAPLDDYQYLYKNFTN